MEQYPIDRGLDHYISDIPTGTAEKRLNLVIAGCSHLPSTLIKVLNIESIRKKYNAKCIKNIKTK